MVHHNHRLHKRRETELISFFVLFFYDDVSLFYQISIVELIAYNIVFFLIITICILYFYSMLNIIHILLNNGQRQTEKI